MGTMKRRNVARYGRGGGMMSRRMCVGCGAVRTCGDVCGRCGYDVSVVCGAWRDDVRDVQRGNVRDVGNVSRRTTCVAWCV